MTQAPRDQVLKAREKELSQYGITAMQAAVLYLLNKFVGNVTPAKISRWLLREHHTVSSILTRMEKKGLVNRVKNLYIKGELTVTMTEKGKQAYRQSLKLESIREILSCLSEQEHHQMVTMLEKLRDKALLKNITIPHEFPYP